MVEKRAQRATAKRAVLDPSQRKMRLKRFLDALDKDNFQEDIDLTKSKLPVFEDKPAPKKKKRVAKHRFPKSLQQALEELNQNPHSNISFLQAQVPPSKLPARHFCAVCGYKSCYKCIVCGAKYCSLKCHETHTDTRCLKWT